jgi:hypothetical protein
MNLIGAAGSSAMGDVRDAMGESFSHRSTVETEAGINPAPDDPVIVT